MAKVLSNARVHVNSQVKEYNTTPPYDFPSGPEILESRLFRHQKSLDSLPVPALSTTLSKYTESIKPLVSDSQFKVSEKIIKAFQGSQGPILQKRLEERFSQKKNGYGWFYEWWNDMAYLTDRGPVVFYVNYFYAFNQNVFERALSQQNKLLSNQYSKQILTASLLVFYSLQFRQKLLKYTPLFISRGDVSPDKGSKGISLCSHMYKYLFNTCRIAQKPYDTTLVYPPEDNKHILVMHNAHLFAFDVLDSKNNVKSINEIAKSIS